VTASDLDTVLEESRSLGFLGPGPIGPQRHHAEAFLPLLHGRGRILDLGSGGGLPGLVLALALPSAEFVLLDGNERRCRFLERSVEALGLAERVRVAHGRAEELARDPGLRGTFDTVVARSFGPPAATAECAAGFLTGPRATLVVSEPPDGSADRWPAEGLLQLGMRPGQLYHVDGVTLQEIDVVATCEDSVPRRVGVPNKRPRF
jgi:16S rRNA (guanine527-N7)-methyltransferase